MNQEATRWKQFNSQAEINEAATKRILAAAQAAIKAHGSFLIVLAGGSTPKSVYQQLAQSEADWSKWHVYHNDDYMCIWRYGREVHYFNETEIANNHLITANDDIRARIDRLVVGDQIHIKGKLVSYREDRWESNRLYRSSMRRDDSGPESGEIILVEQLEVIASHNHVWAYVRDVSFWLFIMIVFVRLLTLLAPRSEHAKRKKKQQSRQWSNMD